mgnify:CR=1 FL=1
MTSINHIPAGVWNAIDYERLAPQHMEAGRCAYVAGGCGWDQTVAANRAAFARWAVLPRLLRDMRAGHTRLTLAGLNLPHPLLLAPVAHQRLAHPDAEIATARAAQATGSCLVASTLSSCTLEDIASASGPARWFQLYLQHDRGFTRELVQRAEAAGFEALALTVDAPTSGARDRERRQRPGRSSSRRRSCPLQPAQPDRSHARQPPGRRARRRRGEQGRSRQQGPSGDFPEGHRLPRPTHREHRAQQRVKPSFQK